jgi:hypothetical protein
MARRRKAGKRTPGGRLSRAHRDPDVPDHGTAESQAKRLMLVNGCPIVELAADAIGVLVAHGHVDGDQMRAGLRYRRAYGLSFGMPIPGSSQRLFEPYAGQPHDDDYLKRARARFEGMARQLGHDQQSAINQVLVDNRLPPWFRTLKLGRRLSAEDEAAREALLSGLAALAE